MFDLTKLHNISKAILLLYSVVVISTLVSACGHSNNHSTDLSLLRLDGITVGDNIEQIDKSKYAVSDRFPSDENTISYEEWRITVDADGSIEKIQASVYSEITLTIGETICSTSKDVIDILGTNYEASTYDREQRLESIVYNDRSNNLQATFVFSSIEDCRLVFVTIEKSVA